MQTISIGTKIYDRKLRRTGVVLNANYKVGNAVWVLVRTDYCSLMWSASDDLEASK